MNLTQKEVAQKIGVGQSTYTNYEAGIREPNNDTLVLIANALNTTTDYLLGRTEKQESYYHAKLEDSIKEAYLSLPREVRANILQAMVDAVQSYQQEESTATIEQSSNESTNDTEQSTDEAQQVDTAAQEESTQQTIAQEQNVPEEEHPQRPIPTIQQEESEVHIRHNAMMRKDIKKKASRNGEKPFVRVLTQEQKDEIRSRPRADEDM